MPETLKELSDRATPGPWYHRQANFRRSWSWIGDAPPGEQHSKVIVGREALYGGWEDYAFVAALVTAYRAGHLHDADALTAAHARGRAEGIREAGEWRPIETAPMHGNHILVARIGAKPIRAWYQNGRWWMHGCGPFDDRPADLTGRFAPTHWMPLPAPPALIAQSEEVDRAE